MPPANLAFGQDCWLLTSEEKPPYISHSGVTEVSRYSKSYLETLQPQFLKKSYAMESSTCIRRAFVSTKLQQQLRWSSCRMAPALIASGVASSNRVLLLRRRSERSSSSWSQQLSACDGASGATDTDNSTPQQKQRVEDKGMDSDSRNLSNFEPSIWGDFFLTYSSPLACSAQKIRMVERADQLKKEVSKKIASSSNCILYERMLIIDVLERLCLDHLFEDEISVALAQINDADVRGCDLQTVALWFYLLRKHGYHVSPDVLAKFCDRRGIFAMKNPSDLLNLYNAAYFRTNGEIILDEAISFTKRSLQSIVPHIEGPLAREIKCALEIPLPRRVRIYESKYHISTYGKETKGGDDEIMELAKLNSNIMQLQHQEELKTITRWWNDLEVQSRLSFARDRVVECYFWVVGVYYEPSYSRGRIILTKLLAIVSILDDTYDAYGTSQECELFTKCIERWDPMVTHGLPEKMKFIFRKILDTCQSIEEELEPGEKYRIPYLKNFIVDLVRAYNKEVKWREEGYVPATVEEHLKVSARSGACHLLSCMSFVGMGDIATKEAFEWVHSMPKIVNALCVILRLSDDLRSYEREKMMSHVASTIDSCMREHKIPFEAASEKIQDLIEETWKDFNGEWLSPNNRQPKQLLERIFNLTRTMVFMYKQDDAYTNCHAIKDSINSLFVEPISME